MTEDKDWLQDIRERLKRWKRDDLDIEETVEALAAFEDHAEEDIENLLRTIEVLKDKLETYGVHNSECICAQHRMGVPIEEGGYRSLYGYGKKEKWFYAPEKPKCECGFAEALAFDPTVKK